MGEGPRPPERSNDRAAGPVQMSAGGSMRALALLLVLPVVVRSHPGAIAEGRASCGAEYGTASAAYSIPDVREAWFVRRIATCEAPVFWTMFDITQEQQELYIAVITPELPRFKDRLVFNGILYGPGVSASLDGLSSLPTNLPAGVTLATNLGDAAYIKSPSSLAECGFVDTNPVMRHYSDVIRGRCMEELRLDASYEDALQADTTSYSWWLYSFNHVAAKPGKYYLQTWLADPASGAVAQGKYEITLAPWSWAGYASKDTQALAQSQGTSCSCSPNALAYKEQDIARLGDLEPALFAAQLPGGACSAAPQPNTACSAQAREPKLSADSAVEWTFRAFFYKHGAGTTTSTHYVYPDPGINVFLIPAASLSEVSKEADQALKQGLAKMDSVSENDTLNLRRAQYIKFTDATSADTQADKRKTSVLIKPDTTGDLAIFTQHLPSEFMAGHLVDVESGAFVFPTSATIFDGDAKPAAAPSGRQGPLSRPRALLAPVFALVVSTAWLAH